MELFRHNTKIDFMAQRKWAAIVSIVLFVFSLGSLAFYGLNWGLDFTGGTQIHLSFKQEVNLSEARGNLAAKGFEEAQVISYGTSRDILVTLMPEENANNTMSQAEIQKALVDKALQALPDASVEEVNFIGPQVGKEMTAKSALAIFFALLGTMVYIAIRFDLRFAVSSMVALIHDPILILGVFSCMHVEFNLISLAAILTVIGYSLNDTIVIFDRVRENFRKMRKADVIEVMNASINQTLSRTIMTSALTLIVVLALFFLGGSLLYGFSLALIIGIIVGTYSSIYVAGTLSIMLGLGREHLVPRPKIVDDRP